MSLQSVVKLGIEKDYTLYRFFAMTCFLTVQSEEDMSFFNIIKAITYVVIAFKWLA